MSYGPQSNRSYQQLAASTDIAAASPHRLIQMLFEGALTNLARAKGHMGRKETAAKGETLGKAVSIVEYLRAVLDERGGDVTDNLRRLYDYVIESLLKANLHNDSALLAEAHELLSTLKQGWDGIETEVPSVNAGQESNLRGAI